MDGGERQQESGRGLYRRPYPSFTMPFMQQRPAQAIIQTALGGYQSINDLIAPKGRLYKQRETCMDMLSRIPGISCVKPKAAFLRFS